MGSKKDSGKTSLHIYQAASNKLWFSFRSKLDEAENWTVGSRQPSAYNQPMHQCTTTLKFEEGRRNLKRRTVWNLFLQSHMSNPQSQLSKQRTIWRKPVVQFSPNPNKSGNHNFTESAWWICEPILVLSFSLLSPKCWEINTLLT